MENPYIQKINSRTGELRAQIINHPVYKDIQTMDELKLFMEFHIFAVWDFMSLLKSLQNNLTCTRVPWFPVGNPDTRFLINEIVAGEESDVDQHGQRMSHFELYLRAMQEAGADQHSINAFCAALQSGQSLEEAFTAGEVAPEAAGFVRFTFEVIDSGQAHLQSAIFTFGREDLIPNMFIAMIRDLHREFPGQTDTFRYYLERHIEVDGDHHSHLALEMTAHLCGTDQTMWQEAEEAIVKSLEQRISLWDGAHRAILAGK
jgi:hypothetical protein